MNAKRGGNVVLTSPPGGLELNFKAAIAAAALAKKKEIYFSRNKSRLTLKSLGN